MNIQDLAQGLILVDLPRQRQEEDELQRVIDRVRQQGECDVVVDFTHTETVGGAIFTQLLELQQLLQEGGHSLILCGVASASRGVFAIARLEDVFVFVKDMCAALAHLKPLSEED